MVDESQSEKFSMNMESLLQACSKNCVGTQKQCTDIIKLLKPWPLKVPDKAQLLQNLPTPQQQQPPTPQAELAPEEVAGLSLMDKALAKAEAARTKYHSKESGMAQIKDKPSSGKPTSSVQKNPIEPLKKTLLQSSNPRTKDTKEIGTIAQSQLNKLLLPKTSKSSAVPKSKQSVLPAHTKAPFMTKPERSGRNRPTSSGHRGSATKASNSRLGSGNRVDSKMIHVKEARGVVGRDDQRKGSRTGAVGSDSSDLKQSQNMSSENQYVQSREVEWVTSDHVSVSSDQVSVSSKRSDVQDVPATNIDFPANSNRLAKKEEITSQKPLEKEYQDLSSITVPGSLRKIAMTNYRLRCKLRQSCLQSKVTYKSSAAERFIQAVEAQNKLDLSGEALSSWCQVTECSQACHSLTNRLTAAANVHAVNGHYDIEDLATVRTQAQQLLQEATLIQEHYNKLIPTVPLSSISSSYDSTSKQSQMPNILHTKPPCYMGSFPSRHNDLLRYEHLSSLLRYHRLQHDVSTLQLRLQIVHTLSKQLTQLLSDTAEDPSVFHAVYRGVYGLLCSSTGCSFPALVQDSPEEEEDGEEDREYEDF